MTVFGATPSLTLASAKVGKPPTVAVRRGGAKRRLAVQGAAPDSPNRGSPKYPRRSTPPHPRQRRPRISPVSHQNL